MSFRNTGVMCMVAVPDYNREEGFKSVDLGNYFTDPNGDRCLVTSVELASRYSRYVNVPIYTRRSL
jgi:hypothetical protein